MKQIQKIKDLTLFSLVVVKKQKKWEFHVVVTQTARNSSDLRAARAVRLFFLTQPIKFLIYGVVVAVNVAHTKDPYC